ARPDAVLTARRQDHRAALRRDLVHVCGQAVLHPTAAEPDAVAEPLPVGLAPLQLSGGRARALRVTAAIGELAPVRAETFRRPVVSRLDLAAEAAEVVTAGTVFHRPRRRHAGGNQGDDGERAENRHGWTIPRFAPSGHGFRTQS